MNDETSLRPRPGETAQQTVDRVVAAVRERQEEQAEMVERIQNFKLEGTTFWREFFIAEDKRCGGGMYSEGDEFAPFFSEAFLYNLVGKDEARSILGIVRELLTAAGVEGRVV